MIKTVFTALACAALSSAALAGTTSIAAGKGKAAPTPPAPEAAPIGITVTGGYDSTYLWHGTRVGEDLITGKIEYNVAMCDKSSLLIGAWYGHLDEFKYNEFDLYAGLTYNLGPANVTVGFTYYDYIDGNTLSNQYEPFVKLSSNGLPVDLYAAYYYETEVSGSYVEVGVGKTITLCSSASLAISANVGYNDGLTTTESGLNHVGVSVALPIALNKNVTFTPYIAGNFAQDATKGVFEDDNLIVGGAAISIKF